MIEVRPTGLQGRRTAHRGEELLQSVILYHIINRTLLKATPNLHTLCFFTLLVKSLAAQVARNPDSLNVMSQILGKIVDSCGWTFL
jgi:hypothetical protein